MKIDRRKAARWPFASSEGDTVWMGAADTTGLVVSYIQSLYWEFGSGCVLPATGVLMQNRGSSFSLQRGALNPLAPGRLPIHTLNPALAVVVEEDLLVNDTLFFNAGRLDRSMELDTKDWLAVAKPRVAKIAAKA